MSFVFPAGQDIHAMFDVLKESAPATTCRFGSTQPIASVKALVERLKREQANFSSESCVAHAEQFNVHADSVQKLAEGLVSSYVEGKDENCLITESKLSLDDALPGEEIPAFAMRLSDLDVPAHHALASRSLKLHKKTRSAHQRVFANAEFYVYQQWPEPTTPEWCVDRDESTLTNLPSLRLCNKHSATDAKSCADSGAPSASTPSTPSSTSTDSVPTLVLWSWKRSINPETWATLQRLWNSYDLRGSRADTELAGHPLVSAALSNAVAIWIMEQGVSGHARVRVRVCKPALECVMEVHRAVMIDKSNAVRRPINTPMQIMRQCQRCGRASGRRCGRCRAVYYCGTTCQEHDWPKHRPLCKRKRTDEEHKASDGSELSHSS